LTELVNAILSLVGGPFGIFLISLVSNSIPFFTIPYLGIVAGYALFYVNPLNKVVLVLASALGATVGKIAIYFMGKAVSKGFSESTKKNVDLFKRIAKRSLFIAILVFAASPLPDDILYVPLGIMGYPILLYFIAILAGKAVLTSIVVLYASWIAGVAVVYLWTIPILIAVTALLTYIVVKVDWYVVINEFYTEGVIAALKKFGYETKKLFFKS